MTMTTPARLASSRNATEAETTLPLKRTQPPPRRGFASPHQATRRTPSLNRKQS